MSKSFELRLSEGVQLVTELEQALARERGAGTPLTTVEYLSLRDIARQWIGQNRFVKRDGESSE